MKGRYILAGFLSVGMSLTGFAGEQIEIQETEIIRYEKPQKVYNFSIEGTENYYVGEQGVLVHNAGGCPSGNEARKKNTETKTESTVVGPYKEEPKLGLNNNTKVVAEVSIRNGEIKSYGVNQTSGQRFNYENLNEPVMYNKSGRVNLVVGDRHGEMERLDNLNKAVGIDGEDVVIKLKIPKNIELKDGKNMCHNCRSDIKYYAKEAGANSVTGFSPDENVRWEKGSNKWIPF